MQIKDHYGVTIQDIVHELVNYQTNSCISNGQVHFLKVPIVRCMLG